MPYKIDYKITGSLIVTDDVYDEDTFEGLSEEEKLEKIAEIEKENGYEAILNGVIDCGKVELEVTKVV